MVRRAKKARRIENPDPTEVVKTPTSLLDLPPEVLHMIFEYRRNDFWRCRLAYMNVCRELREVAVEYLEYRTPRVDNLNHFLGFMQQHSPLPKTVRSIHLSNMPLDAKLVRELTRLFPTLTSLTLANISCFPPYPYHHPQSDSETAPVPMQLETLIIECSPVRPGRASNSGSQWSLSGMMHILSLLAPKTLDVRMDNGICFRDKFEPSCLAATPAVQVLRFHFWETPKKSISNVLDALSVTLAPECLQSVTAKYDTKPSLRALSTLLERIGGNVTNLAINVPVPLWDMKRRKQWSDPLDDWALLDIRVCKKLESLYLPIYVRPRDKSQKALSYVGAGLLANYAPPTLRKVTIDIRDLERPTTLGNRSVLKLQEFDKVITQARFPNLQQFELRVEPTRELGRKAHCTKKCREAALRTLPGLHALGVLDVRVKEW
ncbi:hypothetical protein C8T65DRAFT_692615 [Cerioporus squamosus]|nr:hypothetical protein C8T65DRAFT_692615 [Cerioporus squamosus]